tara:strand:+ start:1173 stop:1556 length:384 start_codon:yes stop_codon:yes gene_type:complete
MSSFAKLGLNSKVKEVVCVDDSIATTEQAGIDFLTQLLNYPFWVQTYEDGSIRKNFAGIGYTYDEDRDAFISPKPFASWILNETNCIWEAPVEKPLTYINNLTDLNGDPFPDYYTWNEETTSWDILE